MPLFWIVAALLAGGAAFLIIAASARAARSPSVEDPVLALHRRQLADIDAQVRRGVIAPADRAAVRAEAARRLLAAADAPGRPERLGDRTSGRIVSLVALLAAAGALGLYLWLGAPGDPDQPYRARVAAWRAANPSSLDPQQMAAVLRVIAADRPNDADAQDFLGRARLASGDAYGAGKAFTRAARLAPRRGDILTRLGEADMMFAGDKPSPAAVVAFRRALALDPKDQTARYYLGQQEIASGDKAAGLSEWRALLTALAPTDPRRASLMADIAHVEGLAAAPPAPSPPAAALPPDAAAFIQSMVAGLAARLQASPDDPQGWARLVRSYGVLHDPKAQTAALARARQLFKSRPADLQAIEAEAKAHPAD